jgi:hypothetical protein
VLRALRALREPVAGVIPETASSVPTSMRGARGGRGGACFLCVCVCVFYEGAEAWVRAVPGEVEDTDMVMHSNALFRELLRGGAAGAAGEGAQLPPLAVSQNG